MIRYLWALGVVIGVSACCDPAAPAMVSLTVNVECTALAEWRFELDGVEQGIFVIQGPDTIVLSGAETSTGLHHLVAERFTPPPHEIIRDTVRASRVYDLPCHNHTPLLSLQVLPPLPRAASAR